MKEGFLTDDEYAVVLEWSYGFAIDSLWLSIRNIREDASFDDCKNAFLEALYRILSEKKARLAYGEFLEGSASDQVAAFESTWPAEQEIDESLFWVTKSGSAWVPSGLVWLYEDGTEVWT